MNNKYQCPRLFYRYPTPKTMQLSAACLSKLQTKNKMKLKTIVKNVLMKVPRGGLVDAITILYAA